MNPRIILVVMMSILALGISFFTAKVYITGFNVSTHPARSIWVTALLVPVAYLAGLVGTQNADTMGRTYYLITNILAGVVLYLFLGAVLLGIVSIGFAIAGKNIPLFIAWAILALSLLSAAGAFIQARTVSVVRYEVVLPGAPASWNGKVAALVSDTHFGLINHKRFSDKVVDNIISLHPDFVLHAGDFYDGPKVDTASITASWTRLASQIPVFYAPGNHETYGDYRMLVDSIAAAGATVLEDSKTEYEGVQIVGTLYHPGREPKEIEDALTAMGVTDRIPAIMINHAPTAFTAPFKHGVDLVVSGHTHRGQTWPLRYITNKIYGVHNYGLSSYETMTTLTTSGIGTYGPPVRLFNSPEVALITFKTQ